jgi:hypothetical protein
MHCGFILISTVNGKTYQLSVYIVFSVPKSHPKFSNNVVACSLIQTLNIISVTMSIRIWICTRFWTKLTSCINSHNTCTVGSTYVLIARNWRTKSVTLTTSTLFTYQHNTSETLSATVLHKVIEWLSEWHYISPLGLSDKKKEAKASKRWVLVQKLDDGQL